MRIQTEIEFESTVEKDAKTVTHDRVELVWYREGPHEQKLGGSPVFCRKCLAGLLALVFRQFDRMCDEIIKNKNED